MHGGDGYSVNVNQPIGSLPSISRYSNNYRPVFTGELLKGGSKYDENEDVFPTVLQNGGSSNKNPLKQFPVLRELSKSISKTKISTKKLVNFNTTLFLNSINPSKTKKLQNEKKTIKNISSVSKY